MGPPAVRMVLVVVLGLTATLPGPYMVHAVPVEDTATNTSREDNQCSLNTLQTQLNGLDTRLSTQQTEANTRFNRIDSRLDGIEMAITDMKDYLLGQTAAMNKKVEWALTDIKPRHDVTGNPHVYTGCQDALTHGVTTSGVYSVTPDMGNSFNVYCEQQLDGGGWTVFQARKDGRISFYRDWSSYKAGFGQFATEFWLGNDKIRRLTQWYDQQLMIELVSPEDEVQYANYTYFSIQDEANKYRLSVYGYSGGTPPGDGFTYNRGHSFNTKDRDNNRYQASCATLYKGGWWFGPGCHNSNLNEYGTRGFTGMNWHHRKGHRVVMKATRMMLRKRP